MESYIIIADEEPKNLIGWELMDTSSSFVKGRFHGTASQAQDLLNKHLNPGKNFLIKPEAFQPKAFFFDMDSTVIEHECIVELAKFAGTEAEVVRITEEAMEGKLDFEQALLQRVATLKGIKVDFQSLFESFQFANGIKELCSALKEEEIPFFLISGGFTELASLVSKKLGFTDLRSNFLQIEDGLLTGKLDGPIIDGQAKQDWLLEVCQSRGIDPKEVVAVGDGANDIPMMKVSGLAVGYKPKPLLYSCVQGVLNDHRALKWGL